MNRAVRPNDLSSFWMPFTANRQFKQNPRMFVSADRMHYKTDDGRQVIDATAGLWCCNAGHNRPKIVKAIQEQAATLDFALTFQMGHPLAFEFASRLVNIAPEGFNHVFFTNSGSESADTALKMALAYHRARGEGSRTRLIGRERGYHGVNFGGMSVGGIPGNRKTFGNMLPHVDHIRHTHDMARNAFSRGQPTYGEEFADELERVIQLHDASNVAAVMIEPVSGSTGVLVPPKGYLEKIRAICDKYGVLLIYDEVITGFGRLGTPFAVDYFGVAPDIFTTAKGITNGVVPMGGVFVKDHIHDAFMNGPEGAIEFYHGYTYSGCPIACAAGLGTLETYADEGLLTRGAELASYWEDGLHALKELPNVIDIRNIGLVGAIELSPNADGPGKRGYNAFVDAFESGLLVRVTGDVIALSPPLIIEKNEIDQILDLLSQVIRRAA